MTRTTAAALALGSALALAACSSHSPGTAAVTTTSPTVASSAGGSSGTPASGTPTASAGPAATGAAAASGAPSASGSPSASTAVSASATASAVASTPAASTAASPTAVAAGSRCTNGHLTVALKAGSPGAGQIYTEIVFTNSGSASCTLAGHPGVSYVAGDDGHQVGSSATRVGSVITTVTLAPGATASALLHETNYQNFEASVCKPVTIRGLRVYPPGSAAAVYLPRPGKQCSATALPDPAMSIAVVKAGTGD